VVDACLAQSGDGVTWTETLASTDRSNPNFENRGHRPLVVLRRLQLRLGGAGRQRLRRLDRHPLAGSAPRSM
jgi:hypothetical protein